MCCRRLIFLRGMRLIFKKAIKLQNTLLTLDPKDRILGFIRDTVSRQQMEMMMKYPSIVHENTSQVFEKKQSPTFYQAFLLATEKNAEFKLGYVWY